MFKRALVAASIAAAFAAPAFADVSIGGSAEMDLFYRTNNTPDGDGKFLEEIAIVVNVDGSDKLDNGSTLKWRLAQKVATDWRYDSWGNREAWIGYADSWGEIRFGNQFTNLYLTQDWPYGAKGQGGLFAEPPIQGFASGITYASPNFNGFSFNLGYDLGTGGKDGKAYEVVGHFTTGGLSIDAGYAATDDASSSGAGNGSGYRLTYAEGTSETVTFAGARYAFDNGFNVTGAWKRQELETAAAGSHEQDFYLVRGGYSFGKHSLSLGYQLVAESEAAGVEQDNEIQQVAFQWDYSISKNSVAFLQIRHNMYDNEGQALGPFWVNRDGWADGKDSTRILVGTWTGF
ncbi:porin [Chitiniphilus purpureus]|uniref:Porin n=1 Tax=Chitiniphilus purpureus TaxID=2981137 RepID=A0ABY6DJX9_9NEIS|nr:porin [Chitiniphilus sp. CD1]UXY14660.1 porin [Chitiniphilus sp. CD1]